MKITSETHLEWNDRPYMIIKSFFLKTSISIRVLLTTMLIEISNKIFADKYDRFYSCLSLIYLIYLRNNEIIHQF